VVEFKMGKRMKEAVAALALEDGKAAEATPESEAPQQPPASEESAPAPVQQTEPAPTTNPGSDGEGQSD
jgi:hypothetical protein